MFRETWARTSELSTGKTVIGWMTFIGSEIHRVEKKGLSTPLSSPRIQTTLVETGGVVRGKRDPEVKG